MFNLFMPFNVINIHSFGDEASSVSFTNHLNYISFNISLYDIVASQNLEYGFELTQDVISSGKCDSYDGEWIYKSSVYRQK
jgi:hypothetical protein